MFSIAFGWRHLLFEHYPVDPETVEPTLPDGLSVDTYDGDAYLSVVPFTNVAVRPLGVPRALGFRLPELNLRTYVTRSEEAVEGDGEYGGEDGGGAVGDDGTTAGDDGTAAGDDRGGDGDGGVYFYSLDADGLLGVVAARLFHRLPYYYADVDLEVVGSAADAPGDRVRFEHRRRHPGARPAEYVATYEPTGEPFSAEPGSLAAFLTERYGYYAAAPGGLRYAAVEHDPWPLQPATADVERDDLLRANGFARPEREPIRHYAGSLDVYASRSLRVER